MKNKIFESADAAVADIGDGATILLHCFAGPSGVAQNLIRALRDKGSKDLFVAGCNMGTGVMAGKVTPDIIYPNVLIANKQVRKVVTSWVGTSRVYGIRNPLEEAVKSGEVEVELCGQGTIAARMRAGGAGIAAFYNPVGVGTILEAGKEKRVINGRPYLLEYPLHGDFGFVRAHKADRMGNLVYRGAGRSYNPVIAMACDVVIAEVDEIVDVGELDPEQIITPGIFVDRIVHVKDGDYGSASHRRALLNRIYLSSEGAELAVKIGSRAGNVAKREIPEAIARLLAKARMSRETIALRAAKEFADGDLVNLGVGIPDLCSLFVPEGRTVYLHSENGVIGFGPVLTEDEIHRADFDYGQAGARFFNTQAGMAFVDHDMSFNIVRGGHLDKTVLGGLQVSERGDLANWTTGSPHDAGIGGGMDMPVGARMVIVTMEHVTRWGEPRIVKQCSYPLTAPECVDLIVTDLAVIQVTSDGLVLKEVAPGWTIEEVQALTEPTLIVADDLSEITL